METKLRAVIDWEELGAPHEEGEWHGDYRRHWSQANNTLGSMSIPASSSVSLKSSLPSLCSGSAYLLPFSQGSLPKKKASEGSRGDGVDGEDWLLVRS